MTEERFTNVEINNEERLIELQDNEVYDCYSEIGLEELLNSLVNENEQLKQQIESYKKVIEDCDNLFCKYGVDTSNLRAVEELFKTLDLGGDVE